tara:strand:- start:23889 stop:25046 length:1158 start_codon:yes stop_codon:yes gene_type:complete
MKVNTLNVLETYAGAGGNPEIHAGWAQAARDRGHNVIRNEIMYAGNPDESWADYDLGYMPEMPGNILNYSAQDVIKILNGKTPDVFYASPPCEGNSVGARMQGWEDWAGDDKKKQAFNRARNKGNAEFFTREGVGPTPTNDAAKLGRQLMIHTLEFIDDLQDYRVHNEGRDTDDPMYWWLENPTGMMRYQPEMGMRPLGQPLGVKTTGSKVPPPTITHASYSGPMADLLGVPRHDIPGHPAIPSRKQTDLWTNAGGIWLPRPHTKPGLHPNAPVFDMSLDELQALYGKKAVKNIPQRTGKESGDAGVLHAWGPRGAKTGVQGIKSMVLPSGVRIPQYHMKSLIPYALGEDTIIAVEKALAGEKTPYPLLKRSDKISHTLFDFNQT